MTDGQNLNIENFAFKKMVKKLLYDMSMPQIFVSLPNFQNLNILFLKIFPGAFYQQLLLCKTEKYLYFARITTLIKKSSKIRELNKSTFKPVECQNWISRLSIPTLNKIRYKKFMLLSDCTIEEAVYMSWGGFRLILWPLSTSPRG